jgi:hypothetical protein
MSLVVMAVGLSQKINSISPSFHCPRLLTFTMKFLISLRRKEIVWEQPGPHTLLCRVELSIPYAMFMQHFVHELDTKSTEYLDMTSGGVIVHCTVEEGRSILDRILSVTPLEDLQIKASLISEDEPIITYLDTSNISASPAKDGLLQLAAPGIGSENEMEHPTPFPLSIEEECFNDDIGNSSKALACD